MGMRGLSTSCVTTPPVGSGGKNVNITSTGFPSERRSESRCFCSSVKQTVKLPSGFLPMVGPSLLVIFLLLSGRLRPVLFSRTLFSVFDTLCQQACPVRLYGSRQYRRG